MTGSLARAVGVPRPPRVHTRQVDGCCDPRGCDGVFGDRFARRAARRYRRRGLGGTEQRMVDAVVSRGIEGASVLEIGGGVGELHLELLRAGAGHATNLELVEAYDGLAHELATEAGLDGRIERRILDIAADPQAVGAGRRGRAAPGGVLLPRRRPAARCRRRPRAAGARVQPPATPPRHPGLLPSPERGARPVRQAVPAASSTRRPGCSRRSAATGCSRVYEHRGLALARRRPGARGRPREPRE